jgi:hypothetical protein
LSRHLPFWIILLLAAGWAWGHPRYADLAQYSFHLRPMWDNVLSEAHAVAYAVRLFFSPWNQNFDHDLPAFHSPAQWPLPLDLLLLLGIAAVAWLVRRRVRLLSFGIGWFAVQLVPLAVIPRVDLLSERNLYLASIGLFLALVVLGVHVTRWLASVSHRPEHARLAAGSVICAVVVALGVMTVQRNALYRDPVLLWSDTVRKSPNKARPHNNLGHAYALHDDWDRAIDEFRTAARLDSGYALAHANLRDAYLHHVGRQD